MDKGISQGHKLINILGVHTKMQNMAERARSAQLQGTVKNVDRVTVTSPIDFPWVCNKRFKAREVQFLFPNVVRIGARDYVFGGKGDPYMVIKSRPGSGHPLSA